MNKIKTQNLIPRPPIVAVMGHVDHGKTSLLDYIKKTNLAAKEAGGITQSIGAYEIIHNEKKITFIDTPGHEAFFKMRARGAKAADLAILVVAADDGVKPQTKESIEILQKTETPFIVAINKIDKPNADVERTKNDLMANGIFLEGYGGNVSWQAISAKTGEGVNELLDLILLAAELENLSYNPDAPAEGIIIESKLDSRKGIVASVIIINGALKTGDEIFTPSAAAKIKILQNFKGELAKKLEPSSPALILGFNNLPIVGEEFKAGELKEFIRPAFKKEKESFIEGKEKTPSLNLIVKADVSGSLEALSGIIKNLPREKIRIRVIEESVGEITDGDVKTAQTTQSIIIGFKTKPNKAAENVAKAQSVKIIVSDIIYELTKAVENEMKLLESPPPLGELKVLEIFSRKGKSQLIGGRVVSGSIKKGARLKILRNNEEIGKGKVSGLKHLKSEIFEAKENQECGLMFESENLVEKNDFLVWME